MTGDWVYGAIAVLALLHGIALLYAYRNGSAAVGAERGEAAECVSDDGVTCPSCGEQNERGYRYCRRCVSELPAQVTALGESSPPLSRRTL